MDHKQKEESETFLTRYQGSKRNLKVSEVTRVTNPKGHILEACERNNTERIQFV